MPNYQPITPDTFAARSWQRPSGFGFAAGNGVVPLSGTELPRAMQTYAIGFIKEAGGVLPAVLLGWENNQNLYVDPNGNWLGAYVPNVLQTYPFRLGDMQDGSKILCIDTDSGLVLDNADGEPFFGDTNTAGELLAKVFNSLTIIEKEKAATLNLCAVLDELDLIVPWDIQIPTEAGVKQVAGLHRVDEKALTELDTEAFEKIRKSHALPVIYSQLLSMQNLHMLTKLDKIHSQTQAQPNLTEGLDIGQQSDELSTIDFSKIGM